MNTQSDARPKLVIIDDESDFLTEMERSLKPLYQVTVLYGSKGIHEQVTALKPDLVLLDVHMPEQGGFELCRKLRADPSFAGTPIVFMSCSRMSEQYRRLLSVKGTRFLHKVSDRQRLLSTLAEALAG